MSKIKGPIKADMTEDQKLKLKFLDLLPNCVLVNDRLCIASNIIYQDLYFHFPPASSLPYKLRDSEMLYLCELVVETLTMEELKSYVEELYNITSQGTLLDHITNVACASWQTKLKILCKIKEITTN